MTQTSDDKTQADELFVKGLQHHERGQLAEASKIYQDALKLHREHFDALHMLGVVALQSGQSEEGVKLIEIALSFNPSHSAAQGHLGNGLRSLERFDEALSSFDKAIELNPNNSLALYNQGFVLSELKRFEDAVESYGKAISVNPDHADAYYERGNALRMLGRRDEAISAFDEAIAINPNFAGAYANRGVVLSELNRKDEALASYEKAIDLNPNKADAYNNRANILYDLMRLKEAASDYEKALELAADNDDIRWNLSQCHLLQGNFESGWQLYEARSKTGKGTPARHFEQPLWNGETDISGKTLFVYWEQGFGDTIQFSRYVRELKNLGVNTILQVERPLVDVMKDLEPYCQIIGDDETPAGFDFHCSLMSLPLAFKTNLETLANDATYLSSRPELVEKWFDQLGPKKSSRVGLVWSGSDTHHDDAKRSIALSQLSPLLRDDVEFISLQVGTRLADLETAQGMPELNLIGSEISDFADTAALIDLMDLVITVDTAVAHLAGAMGKPVWVLLPYQPDWRWLTEREDSPWYTSVRLFRQPEMGDWASVIDRVSGELSSFIEG